MSLLDTKNLKETDGPLHMTRPSWTVGTVSTRVGSLIGTELIIDVKQITLSSEDFRTLRIISEGQFATVCADRWPI